MAREIIHVKNTGRFVTIEDGFEAYIEYESYPGGIDLIHTIVPQEIGRRGIAAELTKYALEFATKQNLKVRPSCSYVESYINKHVDIYGDLEDTY